MSEYAIFTECCIRETGLGKDTANLRANIKDYKAQILILNKVIDEDTRIARDLELSTKTLEKSLEMVKKDQDRLQRKYKILKKITWLTGGLATLSTGILVTSIILTK